MINTILDNFKDKFFTVTFIKKDKTIRTINGRLGVKKYLKGGDCKLDQGKFLIVYSVQDAGYRAINKSAILSIKAQNLSIYNRDLKNAI
jgi:hypothetical protein